MEAPYRMLSKNPRIYDLFDKESFKTALEDSIVVGNAKSEEVKRKRLECFRFINSAFPFYLPMEQHNMMLWDLGYKKGEYWGNAIHFLLSNKAHGFPMWKQFQEQVRSMEATVICRPHISAEMTNRILKHFSGMLHESRESLGMLYEDSVVIQLPFQPVMLFQWLTTALYQILMFESNFCIFYNLPFLENFKPQLLHLQKLLSTTQLNIGFLFDYLQHQVESENDIFVGNLNLFDVVLKKVLCGIKVLSSEKLFDILDNMRIKSYCQGNPTEKRCKLKERKSNLHSRNFLLNLDFWRLLPCKDLKLFGSSEEIIKRTPNVSKWKELTSEQMDTLLAVTFKASLNRKFVVNHAMKDVRLKKMLHELNLIDGVMASMLIKTKEIGAIGGLLLEATHLQWQNEIYKVGHGLAVKFNLPLTDIIDLQLECLELEELNEDELPPLISQHEQLPFSLQDINRHFRHTLKSEYQVPENLKDTVDFFQDRIDTLILKCVEPHLELNDFSKEKDEKLRDWHVPQYLLPCFIASYDDICIAKPPIDDSVQVWYSNFIEKLISEYEGENGIRKSSWANVKKDIEANPVLRDNSELLAFIENVVRSFNKKIMDNCSQIREFVQFCPPWKSFYEVLLSNQKSGSSKNDLSSETSTYWNWLMWDFFSKVKRAIS